MQFLTDFSLENVSNDSLEKELNEHFSKILYALKVSFQKLKTGKANIALLEGIKISYYGSPTPLNQMAQISTPEARLLQIQPFDKTILADIEKALLGANLGVTPNNDGHVIRLVFPPLTEQRRKDVVKEAKKIGEETKVSLRNVRRDFNEVFKKGEKDKILSEDQLRHYQEKVQYFMDEMIKKVDLEMTQKEKEILTL